MEEAGIIERMGAYLDAVRAMDRSGAQDVVAAFEALPKGYGRHLEMKLLMKLGRDRPNIPLLNTRTMLSTKKARGDLEFRFSRDGQVKTPLLP